MTPVSLGGRQLMLHWTIDAAMQYEQQFGRSFFADLDKLLSAPEATIIARIVWACLRETAPEMTIEEIGRLVTMREFRSLMEALGRELGAEQPAQDQEQQGRPPGGAPIGP